MEEAPGNLADRQDAEQQALVARARRGDARAMEQLLVTHLPELEAFVQRRRGLLPGDRESVADIVQSACREALQNLGGFEYRGPAAFRSWLYKVALSKIVQKQRFHRAARRDLGREAALVPHSYRETPSVGDVYATFATPSQAAIAHEEQEQVARAFDLLSADYQEAIYLRRILELPYAEVAAQIGRTEAASRILVLRAVARLALLIGERAGD